MKFIECINMTSFEDVMNALVTIRPTEKEFLPAWKLAWEEIINCTPESSDKLFGYFIVSEQRSRDIDDDTMEVIDNENSYYLEFSFWNTKTSATTPMDFVPWRYWLNVPVSTKSIERFGVATAVAVIMSDMTFYGFTEKTVDSAKAGVVNRLDTVVEKTTAKTENNEICSKLQKFIESLTDEYIEKIASVAKEDVKYNIAAVEAMRMHEWEG